MSEHYYTKNPTVAHDERSFEVELLGLKLNFTADAGVFSKNELDSGTEILLKAVCEDATLDNKRVLDLGCGWGAVGVTVGKLFPNAEIVMTDINTRAAALSEKNLKANNVRATVVTGDGFENVEGTFDCVITNPPIRAGKAVIYDMFKTSLERLNAGGRLYIVIRKQQGAPSAIKYLQSLGADVATIDKSGGFWVLRAETGNDL